MAEQFRVMISSTARDLPQHRKEVMDACLRQGMFPIMMEHLPASDDEAIPASLRMVDESDIYLLILAHRYGYVPKADNPTQISVTEHEYDRAAERKMPILTFVMHEDHPVKAADVEKGEGAVKLEAFKNRALLKVTNFFISPADLRANVIDSLSDRRQKDLTVFHYVSDIPAPPEVYIAHPYTLLQSHTLIGRHAELRLLTDWITGKELKSGDYQASADSVGIMNVVAIGGMGKSALTWKWFNDVAPQEMKDLAGRMWWSFYESDATFENFVTRALVYITKRPENEVLKIPAPEREAQLLAVLHRQSFILVLDGLERILIAYARMDAAQLTDVNVGRAQNLRKCADPRVGLFLKKLAQVKKSRILVSSRLYPAELETEGGDPIPGTFRSDITGLSDDDAIELWRAFGVSGSREELLPVFARFERHPLLIQALAGEVRRYRKAPGNFEEWRKAYPQFDPNIFPKTREAMGFVLEFALRGLDDKARRVLHTIAAFRMPTAYDTLAGVLIGEDNPCANEPDLDGVLSEMEDRGLVGWDKRANRYDLHPIVRGVVWSSLGVDSRQSVYIAVNAHFASLPTGDWTKIRTLEEVAPAIELYNSLIGLGRYDEACEIARGRLLDALGNIGASTQLAQLLEMLFPDGLDKMPRLSKEADQISTLSLLAYLYQLTGQPSRAIPFHERVKFITHDAGSQLKADSIQVLHGEALRLSGHLFDAERVVRASLRVLRESENHYFESFGSSSLAALLATRGDANSAGLVVRRALRIAQSITDNDLQAISNLCLAQLKLWLNLAGDALNIALRIQQGKYFYKPLNVQIARIIGAASLNLDQQSAASENLHRALTDARATNLVEEELPAVVSLAELRRRQGDLKTARELLDDTWELAERGSYPLFNADACNLLAQIERDEGNDDAATEVATKAFRLAWCDGPPFAYHWGLEKAKTHLKELGAPEPEMPPFDESEFEPMPEVEIDPEDEFHVGGGSVDEPAPGKS